MRHASRVIGLGLIVLTLAACGQHAAIPPQTPQRAVAVRQAPANYYKPAQGKRGQALLAALAGIVRPHKDLGYDAARDAMFGEVDDLDNNNVVECDYTERKLEGVTDRRTAFRGGKGFNAEHTWPQSKGAVGAAKSDLHHLFPTDCNANARRGSFPFGEVTSLEWSEGGSQLGTDSRGNTVFEPRPAQKGDSARAILYFFTVYGRQADLTNFVIEEDVLKRWHKEDPVTAQEKARNEAVYRFQGNRNPFVDMPELVDAIGTFLPVQKLPRFRTR